MFPTFLRPSTRRSAGNRSQFTSARGRRCLVALAVAGALLGSGSAAWAEWSAVPALSVSGRVPSSPSVESGSTWTIAELTDALDREAHRLAKRLEMQREARDFFVAQGVDVAARSAVDYARVKIAFEATRSGGLWRVLWGLTGRDPRSDAVWAQWSDVDPRTLDDLHASAIAECDELSALFAFVAHRLGVRDVGLFWPSHDHAVAVWTLPGVDGGEARIVVPTSQLFIGPRETLGTSVFDPRSQRKIFEYSRADVSDDHLIDARTARFFVDQVRTYAAASPDVLQDLRNVRYLVLAGAIGELEARKELERIADASSPLRGGDERALAAFGEEIRGAELLASRHP